MVKANNTLKHHGLTIFGSSLIVISILLAIIGFNSKALNPSGAAVTPGSAMVILAIPITLAGIAITGFGIYSSIRSQKRRNL